MKWQSLQKSKSQAGLWLKEEEDLLSKIVLYFNLFFIYDLVFCSEYQKSNKNYCWTHISEKFNLESSRGIIRLPKHCREKWINHLNPDLIKYFFQLFVSSHN